jgi:hypothetical protein
MRVTGRLQYVILTFHWRDTNAPAGRPRGTVLGRGRTHSPPHGTRRPLRTDAGTTSIGTRFHSITTGAESITTGAAQIETRAEPITIGAAQIETGAEPMTIGAESIGAGAP